LAGKQPSQTGEFDLLLGIKVLPLLPMHKRPEFNANRALLKSTACSRFA
jgi:hypothetical protein